MNYEPKKCHFCSNNPLQKYGKKNGTQRYKCTGCGKTFSAQKSLDPTKIWHDYSIGKQTYKQLAERYQCSVRTIQRYLEKAPKTALKPPENNRLNLLLDTTFFGRDFGVLVLMDSHAKKPVYHQIVKTEKGIYYKIALNKLREKAI